MPELREILPLLIPLILVQLGLAVYSLILLKNAKTVRGNSKLLWIFIIVFINLFGPIIFLIIGRQDDAVRSEDE